MGAAAPVAYAAWRPGVWFTAGRLSSPMRTQPGGMSCVLVATSSAGLSAKKGPCKVGISLQLGHRMPSLEGRPRHFLSGASCTRVLRNGEDLFATSPSEGKGVQAVAKNDLALRLPGCQRVIFLTARPKTSREGGGRN